MPKKACSEYKVELRAAEPDDLARVINLIDSYADGMEFDHKVLINNAMAMIEQKALLLVEYNGAPIGVLAGYINKSLFRDVTMFNIMFFYIKEEFRFLTGATLKELEFSLIATPVNMITLGLPTELKNAYHLMRYFQMKGFKILEYHFQKRI